MKIESNLEGEWDRGGGWEGWGEEEECHGSNKGSVEGLKEWEGSSLCLKNQ